MEEKQGKKEHGRTRECENDDLYILNLVPRPKF